jgi:hypothetical protein
MPDAVEEAKTVAFILDTRSVYTRIGIESFFSFFFKSISLLSFNL